MRIPSDTERMSGVGILSIDCNTRQYVSCQWMRSPGNQQPYSRHIRREHEQLGSTIRHDRTCRALIVSPRPAQPSSNGSVSDETVTASLQFEPPLTASTPAAGVCFSHVSTRTVALRVVSNCVHFGNTRNGWGYCQSQTSNIAGHHIDPHGTQRTQTHARSHKEQTFPPPHTHAYIHARMPARTQTEGHKTGGG